MRNEKYLCIIWYTIKHIPLLSSSMRWYHNLKTISYGIYHIVYILVELSIDPSEIYMRNNSAHGEVIINLWPGSWGLLIDPQIVQQTVILRGRERISKPIFKICIFSTPSKYFLSNLSYILPIGRDYYTPLRNIC